MLQMITVIVKERVDQKTNVTRHLLPQEILRPEALAGVKTLQQTTNPSVCISFENDK